MALAGERPPIEPPTAQRYTEAGLPRFDDYGDDTQAIAGAEKLRGIESVARTARKKGRFPLPGNETFAVTRIVGRRSGRTDRVREMTQNGAPVHLAKGQRPARRKVPGVRV